MKVAGSTGRYVLEVGERLVGHTIAIILGIVLMFIGLGMGLTMVMLPVGIPLGLVGLMLFLWGLNFGAPRERT
jgi:hypothetical protein